MKKIKKLMIFLIILLFPIVVFAKSELEITNIEPEYDINQKIILGNNLENENFYATMTGYDQQLTYKITIKNTGENDIEVKKIIPSSSSIKSLNYSFLNINQGDMIKSGEEKIFTLNIETHDKAEEITEAFEKIRLDIEYGMYQESSGIDNPDTTDFIIIIFVALFIISIAYLFVRKKLKEYLMFCFILISFVGGINLISAEQEKNILSIIGTIKLSAVNESDIVKLEIDPNGGTFNSSSQKVTWLLEKGTTVNLENITRQDYNFINWTINNSQETFEEKNITVNKDTLLTANWESTKYYTLTVDPNGGTYNNSTEKYIASLKKDTIYKLDTFEKNGYKLLNIELNGEVYDSNEILIDKDITIKANWQKLEKYTITINPNGGLFNNSADTYTEIVTEGTKISLADIKKEEYDFSYWLKNEKEQYNSNEITVTENITLVAQWEKIIYYNLEINPNSGTYNGSSEVYKAKVRKGTIIDLSNISKEYYIFDKWTLNNDKSYSAETITINEDTNLVAEWLEAVASIEKTLYPSISAAEIAAKTNDTIVLLKDTTEVVINTKIVTLDLNNHKVTGSLTNEGTITIINGVIENLEGPAVTNNGTLNLGINDYKSDNTPDVSIDSVALIGTTLGIKQNGIFNFYDGYLEGDIGLGGSYQEIPTDYVVFVDHNDKKNCQKVYLIPNSETTRAVAKTIDTGLIYYFNLQDALNSTFEYPMTVFAIRDFEAAHTLNIPENKKAVFDIIGFNVATGYTITNDGTFEIKDSSTEKGQLKPATYLDNNGNLILRDITIEATTDANVINNLKNVNLYNSSITSKKGYAINNTSTGKFDLDNTSVIKGSAYALYHSSNEEYKLDTKGTIQGIYSDGYLNIINANILNNGSNDSIYIASGNNIITNAKVESTAEGIRVASGNLTIENINLNSKNNSLYAGGTVILNGGTLTSKSTTVHVRNSFTMNGGILNSSYNGIYNEAAKLIINGGTINAQDGVYNGQYCPMFCSSGSFTVNGGTINATRYGLNVYNGTAYVRGGTINGETYGIYNRTTTIIGTKNEVADSTTPNIKGKLYGVYLYSGTVNFYDGILKGQTGAYYGTISAIEDAHLIFTGTENIEGEIYETKYLKEQDAFVQVGDTKYNSLNKAIAAIENEGTMYLIADASISTTATIPAEKTIVFDLNGHTLTSTQQIINNGNLTITDSSEVSTGEFLVTTTIDAINNNGTFIMSSGIIRKTKTGAALYNSAGTATINGGLLESYGYGINVESGAAIVNDGIITSTNSTTVRVRGSFTLNGGTINSIYNGIYNEAATLIVNGGTINAKDGIYNGQYCPMFCSSGSFTVNGGTINATNYGLNVYNGTAYINGGIINGEVYGIYNRGKSYIGQNNTSVSINTPIISGGTYGLYMYSGTSYFYDGTLKGTTNGYYGTINAIPDSYIITTGSETINNTTYVTKYLKEQDAFVQVGDTKYNSLNKAIAAIESEGTMYLIADASISTTATIPAEKTVIFDLNGHTLTSTQQIINSGTLTIEDNSTNQNGEFYVTTTVDAINNSGTFIINSGTIRKTSSGAALYNNGGTSTLEGGLLKSYGYGVNIESGQVINNNGTITSTNNTGVRVRGKFTQNNGIINSSGTGIYNEAATLIVNGGTINANDGIYNGQHCPLFCSSGSFTVNGGTINATRYGLNVAYGTAYVYGGIINGETYGIYNEATTNIGDSKNEVDITTPNINGGLYGLYRKSGSVNFYDGTIKGTTSAYYGVIKNIATDYYIHESTENIDETTYIKRYLLPETEVVSNGAKKYVNIQTAIDEATTNDTLTIIKNTDIYYSLTIPQEKELTIDLAGYTLKTNKTITNNGTLHIVDSQGTGKLEEFYGNILLNNNNNMYLDNINIANEYGNESIVDTISGAITEINNNTMVCGNCIKVEEGGNTTINNSNLSARNYAINNAGTITINKGTYSGTQYSLYSSGTTQIEGSEVNGYLYVYNGTTEISKIKLEGNITNKGTLTINDSEINKSVVKTSSILIENKGTFTSNNSSYTLNKTDSTSYEQKVLYNDGIVSLNNTNFSLNDNYANNSKNDYVIYNYSDGSISYNKGSINLNGGKNAYGIYAIDTSSFTMLEGNIEISSVNSYGIYINGGTVSLGEKESTTSENYGTGSATVSTTNPLIRAIGTTTGIGIRKVNGYFMFYDGIIFGSTSAKPDTTTEVEYNYEATTKTEESTGYEYCILEYLK